MFKKAFNYLLPDNCVVCNKLGVRSEDVSFNLPENFCMCSECISKLVPVPKDRRWLLLLSEPFEEDPFPGQVLYMPFTYDDLFKVLIPAIKFKKKQHLAEFLGMLLGNLMANDNIVADVIVPIPLSEERLKERGFNQAQVIADAVSKVMNIEVVDALARVKNTKRQTGIKDNSLRSLNIMGAFKVSDELSIKGKTILLIDDVATTGHTMHEAVSELYKNGAKKVLCVALCGNRSVKNADPY